VPVRSLWSTALRSGVIAAVAGIATAEVIAVLCWLPDAGVSGRASSALKAGLLSFLAAQHGGVTVNGISGGFLPLGMLLGVALFAWRAGQAIAESAASVPPVPPGRSTSGDDDTIEPKRLVTALLLGSSAYTACCVIAGTVSKLGTSHAPPVATPVAAFVLFSVVAGAALLRMLPRPLPNGVVGAVRGAVLAAALYLAAGALLAAGSLVLHAHRVVDISRQVGGGLSGLPILVIDLLCAPNAAVAGSAYLAGPGFAVGRGTTVNAFSASHGVLPALPVLGAVPDGPGANPIVLALMSLVPLLAAVGVARAVRRAGIAGWLRQVGFAALSGTLAGVLLAIAAWLGGGSAGVGRLRVVGASPWKVGFAVALVVAVLSVLAVAVLAAWDRLVPPRPVGDDDVAEARQLTTASTR
jgi:hypothetical protein